jgi:Ca-activated chloride channel family protein
LGVNPSLLARPEALGLLLLVPLLGWWLRHAEELRLRALAAWGGAATPSRIWVGFRRRAFLGAVTLAVLALAGPQGSREAGEDDPRAVDVVVCLDVSRSMLAQDLRPSRLSRARAEVRALAEHATRDRFALVCFAGEARLAVPLTEDRRTFAGLVDLAGPASVPRGGTDLGAALEQALVALEGGEAEHAVVLLLTDGEDLEERGRAAAEACREAGVVVHAVGFGSALGSRIAVREDGAESFVRDPAGAEVLSRLDAAGLRAVAETAGGEYVEALAGADALVPLWERRVRPMAGRRVEGAPTGAPRPLHQSLLLLAFLLGILELGARRRPE